MKAHEKLQNVDNGALGQKGRMRFFLNIFRKKGIRAFGPRKQAVNANQHYKEVSLPIGQKSHPTDIRCGVCIVVRSTSAPLVSVLSTQLETCLQGRPRKPQIPDSCGMGKADSCLNVPCGQASASSRCTCCSTSSLNLEVYEPCCVMYYIRNGVKGPNFEVINKKILAQSFKRRMLNIPAFTNIVSE